MRVSIPAGMSACSVAMISMRQTTGLGREHEFIIGVSSRSSDLVCLASIE